MSWTEWADAVEIEPSIYASDFSRLGEQLEALRRRGRAGLPLRRRRRALHPRDHDRTDRRSPRSRRSCAGGERGSTATSWSPSRSSTSRRSRRPAATASPSTSRSCDEPARAVAHARSLGLGVGVALNPETAVEDAVAAAEGVDLVLCMSIHPGLLGPGVHAGGARADRAAARAPARRRARPGGRRDQPRDALAPHARRARISSSPGARSSGATIPPRRTASSSDRRGGRA